jgi:hemerythrin-like domain-containing protein
MRAVVGYLERFRLGLHHQKEEEQLFRRLRERTSAFDTELDELERQHERDRLLVAEMSGCVEALSAVAGDQARASAVQALHDVVAHYAAFSWEHLGREEAVILPAARRHLTAEDWADVDAAFARGSDSRRAGAMDPISRQLLSRVLELARSPTA